MLGKNYRIFKMLSGEMVIVNIKETDDEGKYIVEYPAIIQVVQQGGQQQVGMGKLMPFSDGSKDMSMNPNCIAIDSEPDSQMIGVYEQFMNQMRSQQSGIVVPSMRPPQDVVDPGGQKIDFGKLNT